MTHGSFYWPSILPARSQVREDDSAITGMLTFTDAIDGDSLQ